MKKIAVISGLCLFMALSVKAQYVLSLGTYDQDFSNLGTGTTSVTLPTGWFAADNATSSTVGTQVTSIIRDTWSDTAAGLRNVAGVTGLTSTSTTTQQNSSTDRAFGYRQSASVGDPGAALAFNFDSSGFTISSISFDFLMVSVQARSTTWSIQISGDGITWSTLGTISDSSTWGSANYSFSSGLDSISNSSSAYFRLAALTASSGSGSRDTIAIDNFSITAVPEPHEYAIAMAGLLGLVIFVRRYKAVGCVQ